MSHSRAFSLAEALVAFAVVVIASLTLTVTYSFSQARVSQRADQLQAVSYAQQCIEYVREQIRDGLPNAISGPKCDAKASNSGKQPVDPGYALFAGADPYPSPGASSTPAPIPSSENFTGTPTVTQIGTTNAYDVSVTVTWLYAGQTQSVVVASVVNTQAP